MIDNITYKKETVKIAETYQNMIMQASWKWDYEMYIAVQAANKYKVWVLTWLSEDEINELEPSLYSEMLTNVWAIMNTWEAFNNTDYEEKKKS